VQLTNVRLSAFAMLGQDEQAATALDRGMTSATLALCADRRHAAQLASL
jgi:acyl-CoA dehydrogenase